MVSNSEQPTFGTYSPSPLVALILAISQNSFLGRGKFRKWMYSIIHRLHNDPIDTQIWGAPIRLDPRTNPGERAALFRTDRIDVGERAIMHGFLASPGSVMVDLGANMGFYALDAAINGPVDARVVAVEANPTMADRLEFNIDTMRSAGIRNLENLHLFKVAVGAEKSVAPMTVTGAENVANMVDCGEDTIDVQVLPLLHILEDAGIERIDFLKIDVEGYEGEALGPFLEKADDELLPQCIQIEHLEAERWTRDIFSLMTKRGYRKKTAIGVNDVWALQAQD